MKKELVLIALLLTFLAIPLALADDDINSSYSCLEGKVKGKCSTLPLEEQSFSVLALAYDSSIYNECKSSLISNMKDNECWPKSACKLRDTAIATLALQRINQDTDKPESWLLSQTKIPTEMSWYLEIDSSDTTSCTIKYDNSSTVSNTVTQDAGKKLTITGSGNCLSLAYNGYWLQISQSCLNKVFKVTCTKDFYTSLLYKKTNSDVWYISSKTQHPSAGGEAENQVISWCFKQNNECNYEGSLWAVLALQKDNNVENYLPYLIAMAPDNDKYFPYAFLHILSSSDSEYFDNVKSSQYPAGFWDKISGYEKYYDTALAILSLKDSSDESLDNAKTWLLSSRDANGCWRNSVRDTAFLLYAGWQKESSGTTGGGEITYCEDFGNYCSSDTECAAAGGEILEQFTCRANNLKKCCDKQIVQQTCIQLGGTVCSTGEICSGTSIQSSDSNCCQGQCTVQQTYGCNTKNYVCNYQCSDTEDEKTSAGYECPSGQVCCVPKTGGGSYLWLWILIILIILLVLAIIFRNRLRAFLFSLRNRGGRGSPVQQTRPPFPPSAFPPRMPLRPMPRYIPPQPQRGKTKTDEELDATFKKLREISK